MQPSNYKALPSEGEDIKGIFNAIWAAGLWLDESERGRFIFAPTREQYTESYPEEISLLPHKIIVAN